MLQTSRDSDKNTPCQTIFFLHSILLIRNISFQDDSFQNNRVIAPSSHFILGAMKVPIGRQAY